MLFYFSCRISETPPYESSSASQSPSRPPVGDRDKEGSKSPEGGRHAAGGGGAGTGGDSSEVDLESLESGRGGGGGGGGGGGKGGADLSEDSGSRNLDVEGGATVGGASGHRGAGGKRKLSMGECQVFIIDSYSLKICREAWQTAVHMRRQIYLRGMEFNYDDLTMLACTLHGIR